MKHILSFLLSLTLFSAAGAAPSKSQLASQQARRTAADLFVAGKRTEAIAHLQAQLKPEDGPEGAKITLVQGLMDVACILYNQRRLDIARDVVGQASSVANELIAAPTLTADRKAALLSSMGGLCENVLVDLKQAESLYRMAETLKPGDPAILARKRTVIDKQASPRS